MRIEALRFNSFLDQALLVILIVDNKIVLHLDVLAISAEDARAECVERAHRQVIRLITDEVLHAVAHLTGRPVGERDGQYPPRIHFQRAHEVGDAVGDDPFFPDPGPAMMRTGPVTASTARRWSSLRFWRISRAATVVIGEVTLR